jgi:competence protein ComEA
MSKSVKSKSVKSKPVKYRRFLLFLVTCIPLTHVASSTLASSEFLGNPGQDGGKNPEYNRQVLAQLPDGDGKTLLATGCVNCHSLSQVASGHKNVKAWTHTVEDMISRGSSVDPDQTGTLAKYLADNFGPLVNINKASAGDLAAIPGLDAKLGAAIVSYREKNGAFANPDELSKVDGISPEILKKARNRLTVGSPEQNAGKQ